MAAPQPSIRILHSASTQELLKGQVEGLHAEVEHLQQAKTKLAADRKRLTDELRVEREGRERAEGLLRKLDKQVAQAGTKAAKVEELRRAAWQELRTVTYELQQAEGTIQSLLRQLIEVKSEQAAAMGKEGRAPSPLSGGGRAPAAASVSAGGSAHSSQPGTARGASSHSTSPSPMAAPSSSGGGGAAGMAVPPSPKSAARLLAEVEALRAAKARAEASSASLEERLAQLSVNSDLMSRELLQQSTERGKLLQQLAAREADVTNLHTLLEALHNQLDDPGDEEGGWEHVEAEAREGDEPGGDGGQA